MIRVEKETELVILEAVGRASVTTRCACLHVDESGHDDGISVIEERPAEDEVSVIPDGDGVDQAPFDLHCTYQSNSNKSLIEISEMK